MNIKLMNFQQDAVTRLLDSMEGRKRDIILKSPTGSGKTIILTHFMDEYLNGHPETVFVWLTPGKGNLEEQSKKKMDAYIHDARTKLLDDVMNSGFEEGDCCFINWEKLTKKGNNALKDSERTNFLEWIQKAFDKNLHFKVIIDESHQNSTVKADEIIQYFKTNKIVRSSATPERDKNAELIEIKESDVIAEGLIKKMIVINGDFPQNLDTENQTTYLLERGLEKQGELRALFRNRKLDINPLIVVQIPNNSDLIVEQVERFFEEQRVTYENKKLSIWLSERHENLEGIEENDADPVAVIIKQAIATGWDCPRAHILVKLRENMKETFEIQTIGRIRRMPEAIHYGDDALDSCYLYTFDEKFVQGVRETVGTGALEAKTLFLKNEHKRFTLTKEQRTLVTDLRDPREALEAIKLYFKKTFKLLPGGKKADREQNRKKLESNGFIFSDKVERNAFSGTLVTLDNFNNYLNKIKVSGRLNTSDFGKLFHFCVGRIGKEIGMPYSRMRTILFRLFCEKFTYKDKFMSLIVREMYAFVINNFDRLRRECRSAMAAELENAPKSQESKVSKKEFRLPQSTLFTYDGSSKVQKVSKKNVYQGYLLSAQPRSASEVKFEKFCEECGKVDWIYKNGDKGDEYFSLVYEENSRKQDLFYPDYILSIKGTIWIIETKGGFRADGESEDIDRFSEKKFNALKAYLKKHPELKGGFVRFDKKSDELIITTEKYVDDVSSDSWMILKDFIEKL